MLHLHCKIYVIVVLVMSLLSNRKHSTIAMTQYRIPLRKTQSMREIMFTLLTLVLLLSLFYGFTDYFCVVWPICGVVFLFSVAVSAVQWFYVELSDEQMALKIRCMVLQMAPML